METPNPLREGQRLSRIPEPCAVIIFGASGDLTRRKLMPAIYGLSQKRSVPGGFQILGISRSGLSAPEYRNMLRDWAAKSEDDSRLDDDTWGPFAQHIHYLSADYHNPQTYALIKEYLSGFDLDHGTEGNRLYYLATPPSDYADIVRNLGAAGLNAEYTDGQGWSRIVIEKPFGSDLDSARRLNDEVSAAFHEEQVYRIDHYLGKETVQNLLVFRFANGIFEPIWNRQYVNNIQITAAEDIGVGTRGGYYEQAGALRDMVQNHVMQLMALVAMEPPADFSARSVRDEKAKVLHSIRPYSSEEVARMSVRGQYGPGFIRGKEVRGYRQEGGVAPDSKTETFAAIRFNIENWRWAGVPFYVRTGKNLAKRITEIAISFNRTPHFIFSQASDQNLEPNVLALRIQPDEGITLKFVVKFPGQLMNIRPVNMDFRYGATFGFHLSSAYERLLLDCMLGDATLFDRIDSVEAAWTIVQPFLETWANSRDLPMFEYPSGTWGPAEADRLLAQDGRIWRIL